MTNKQEIIYEANKNYELVQEYKQVNKQLTEELNKYMYENEKLKKENGKLKYKITLNEKNANVIINNLKNEILFLKNKDWKNE